MNILDLDLYTKSTFAIPFEAVGKVEQNIHHELSLHLAPPDRPQAELHTFTKGHYLYLFVICYIAHQYIL